MVSKYDYVRDVCHRMSRLHGWGIILIAREQLHNLVLKIKPRFVLDIGCHNMLLCRTIEEWLYDISHRCVCYGLDVVKYDNNPTVLASGDKLPFRVNSFDLVTIVEALEHIPNYVGCLYDCYRVLKPSGYIFIQSVSCLSEHAWKGDETHFHVLHPETLARLLRFIGFEVVKHGLINLTFYLIARKPC